MKNEKHYLDFDYSINTKELKVHQGGGILAYYTDFPYILGEGDTREEAIQDAQDTFKCYIEVSLETGNSIEEFKIK